jgi:hypothetical protein
VWSIAQFLLPAAIIIGNIKVAVGLAAREKVAIASLTLGGKGSERTDFQR